MNKVLITFLLILSLFVSCNLYANNSTVRNVYAGTIGPDSNNEDGSTYYSSLGTTQWTRSAHPNPLFGSLTGFAISSQETYAITEPGLEADSGRIYLSTDRGMTWDNGVSIGVRGIFSIALDQNYIYVGLGNYQGTVCVKANDHTNNWNTKTCQTLPTSSISALTLSADDKTIYAGTQNDFVCKKANDGAKTPWDEKNCKLVFFSSNPDTQISSLAIDPRTNILYANIVDVSSPSKTNNVICTSKDEAVTWSCAALPAEIPDKRVFSNIVVNPANGNVFVGAHSGNICLSTNEAKTWACTPSLDGSPIFSLAVDNSGNYLYAGTLNNIFISQNAGQDWAFNTTIGEPVGALAVE